MKATFEITAKKKGRKTVRYWTTDVYYGISSDLYEKYETLGYYDIQIRMI